MQHAFIETDAAEAEVAFDVHERGYLVASAGVADWGLCQQEARCGEENEDRLQCSTLRALALRDCGVG